MRWKACSPIDERICFVARVLDGESVSDVCREFGILRKAGYKIFSRYRKQSLQALSDDCRRPVQYANQLPAQVESLIATCKCEKPHWGAQDSTDPGAPSAAAALSRRTCAMPIRRRLRR